MMAILWEALSYGGVIFVGGVLGSSLLTLLDQYFSRKRMHQELDIGRLKAIERYAHVACDAWHVQRNLGAQDSATQNGWYERQEAISRHTQSMLALGRVLGKGELFKDGP